MSRSWRRRWARTSRPAAWPTSPRRCPRRWCGWGTGSRSSCRATARSRSRRASWRDRFTCPSTAWRAAPASPHEDRGRGGRRLRGVPALLRARPSLRRLQDDRLRFAFLARAAVEYFRSRGERPSVFHAHDWQTGLVPVYLKAFYGDDPTLGRMPSVFTIHNIAYQGQFGTDTLGVLGLPWNLGKSFASSTTARQLPEGRDGLRGAREHGVARPTRARSRAPSRGLVSTGCLARAGRTWPASSTGWTTTSGTPGRTPTSPVVTRRKTSRGRRPARPTCCGRTGCPSSRTCRSWASPRASSGRRASTSWPGPGGTSCSGRCAWWCWGRATTASRRGCATCSSATPTASPCASPTTRRSRTRSMAGADMFLMPSRCEPCGLTQMYALATGRPDRPGDRRPRGHRRALRSAKGKGTGFRFDYADGTGLLWAVDQASRPCRTARPGRR